MKKTLTFSPAMFLVLAALSVRPRENLEIRCDRFLDLLPLSADEVEPCIELLAAIEAEGGLYLQTSFHPRVKRAYVALSAALAAYYFQERRFCQALPYYRRADRFSADGYRKEIKDCERRAPDCNDNQTWALAGAVGTAGPNRGEDEPPEAFPESKHAALALLDAKMAQLEELDRIDRWRRIFAKQPDNLMKIVRYTDLYRHLRNRAAQMAESFSMAAWDHNWDQMVHLAKPDPAIKKTLDRYAAAWRDYRAGTLKPSSSFIEKQEHHKNKLSVLQELLDLSENLRPFDIHRNMRRIIELIKKHDQKERWWARHETVEKALRQVEINNNPSLDQLKKVQAALQQADTHQIKLEESLAGRVEVFLGIPNGDRSSLKKAIVSGSNAPPIRRAARRELKEIWDREIDSLLNRGDPERLSHLASLIPAYEAYIGHEPPQAGCIKALCVYFETLQDQISCAHLELRAMLDPCGAYLDQWPLPDAGQLTEKYRQILEAGLERYFGYPSNRKEDMAEFSWEIDWPLIQLDIEQASRCNVAIKNEEILKGHQLLKAYRLSESLKQRRRLAQEIWAESKMMANSWRIPSVWDFKKMENATRVAEVVREYVALHNSGKSPEEQLERWKQFANKLELIKPISQHEKELFAKAKAQIKMYSSRIDKEQLQNSMGKTNIAPKHGSGSSIWSKLSYLEKVQRLWEEAMSVKNEWEAKKVIKKNSGFFDISMNINAEPEEMLESILSNSPDKLKRREIERIHYMIAQMQGSVGNLTSQIQLYEMITSQKRRGVINIKRSKGVEYEAISHASILKTTETLRNLKLLFQVFEEFNKNKGKGPLIGHVNNALQKIRYPNWNEVKPQVLINALASRIDYTLVAVEHAIKARTMLGYLYIDNQLAYPGLDQFLQAYELMNANHVEGFTMEVYDQKSPIINKNQLILKICIALNRVEHGTYRNVVRDPRALDAYHMASNLCQTRLTEEITLNELPLSLKNFFELIKVYIFSEALPIEHKNKQPLIEMLLKEGLSKRIFQEYKKIYTFIPESLSLNSVYILRTYWRKRGRISKTELNELYNNIQGPEEKKAFYIVFSKYLTKNL